MFGGSGRQAVVIREYANSDPLLEKYSLGDRLGQGAHATVYTAVHKPSGKSVAIKVVNKTIRMRDRQKALQALQRESSIITKLKHPHIVHIYEYIDSEKAAYFVMELLTGGELFDKIVELGSFTERDAAECIRNITSALAYLHNHGIVHRDLKPENLLLRSKKSLTDVCICDFGYARVLGGMARANSIVGTADYVAPEVLSQRGYTERVDEWSLGVITYCLLCGYPPFHGYNDFETMQNVQSGWFDFPAEEWADVSPAALGFIRSLLRPDPLLRMTADEALEHEWLVKMVNVSNAQLPSLDVGLELNASQQRRRSNMFGEFLSPRKRIGKLSSSRGDAISPASSVGSPKHHRRSPKTRRGEMSSSHSGGGTPLNRSAERPVRSPNDTLSTSSRRRTEIPRGPMSGAELYARLAMRTPLRDSHSPRAAAADRFMSRFDPARSSPPAAGSPERRHTPPASSAAPPGRTLLRKQSVTTDGFAAAMAQAMAARGIAPDATSPSAARRRRSSNSSSSKTTSRTSGSSGGGSDEAASSSSPSLSWRKSSSVTTPGFAAAMARAMNEHGANAAANSTAAVPLSAACATSPPLAPRHETDEGWGTLPLNTSTSITASPPDHQLYHSNDVASHDSGSGDSARTDTDTDTEDEAFSFIRNPLGSSLQGSRESEISVSPRSIASPRATDTVLAAPAISNSLDERGDLMSSVRPSRRPRVSGSPLRLSQRMRLARIDDDPRYSTALSPRTGDRSQPQQIPESTNRRSYRAFQEVQRLSGSPDGSGFLPVFEPQSQTPSADALTLAPVLSASSRRASNAKFFRRSRRSMIVSPGSGDSPDESASISQGLSFDDNDI